MRALAIEFFWPVALFCSAPMELGFGSSLLVRFQAGRCPEIDNVVTAALLPHQPDELRRRRDRYDNGERATPLYRTGDAMEPQNSSMISRARVHARARKAASVRSGLCIRRSGSAPSRIRRTSSTSSRIGRTQFDRIPYNLNQFGVLASSPITRTRISMASLKNCLEKKVGLHHLE